MIYVIVATEKFVVVESNKLELQNSKCNLKIVSGDHINHKGSVQNPVMVESRLWNDWRQKKPAMVSKHYRVEKSILLDEYSRALNTIIVVKILLKNIFF